MTSALDMAAPFMVPMPEPTESRPRMRLFNSHKRSYHSQHRLLPQRKQEQLQREAQELERELQFKEASRQEVVTFIRGFLREHEEWSTLLMHISIVQEEVPIMEEFLAYGRLESAEGTKACRKLIKAPVVWDEVGRSLWEKLEEICRKGTEVTAELEYAEAHFAVEPMTTITTSSQRRPSSRDSDASHQSKFSIFSRRSSSSSATTSTSAGHEQVSRRKGSSASTTASRAPSQTRESVAPLNHIYSSPALLTSEKFYDPSHQCETCGNAMMQSMELRYARQHATMTEDEYYHFDKEYYLVDAATDAAGAASRKALRGMTIASNCATAVRKTLGGIFERKNSY